MRRTALLALVCCACLSMLRGAAAAQHWSGTIELPQTLGNIEFSVSFENTDEPDALSATMSIPLQGLKDGKLTHVTYNTEGATFTLELPGAPPAANARFEVKFDATPDGSPPSKAQGTLYQHGQELPVVMHRVEDKSELGLKRPQQPKPPYPYEVREVTFENPDAPGVSLSGTLTVPEGASRAPAVVLITGSGPQDRDETIFEHKPFHVIADYLARNGVAALRYDDRGVAQSTGSFEEATVFDFASDVKAALDFLQEQPGIDRHRLGLIGHSEGGIVAPLVATQRRDVQYLVLLAPTAVTGDQVLVAQTTWLLEQAGATPDQIQRRTQAFRKTLDLVKQGASAEEIAPYMKEVLVIDAEVSGDPSVPDDQAIVAISQGLASRWMREFLIFNPFEYLKQVKVPVLVLLCELDRQVFPNQNAKPLNEALAAAPATDTEMRILPGLNHLFQHATTGAISEYPTIEETFSPEALKIITNWIVYRNPPQPPR